MTVERDPRYARGTVRRTIKGEHYIFWAVIGPGTAGLAAALRKGGARAYLMQGKLFVHHEDGERAQAAQGAFRPVPPPRPLLAEPNRHEDRAIMALAAIRGAAGFDPLLEREAPIKRLRKAGLIARRDPVTTPKPLYVATPRGLAAWAAWSATEKKPA